MNDLKMIVWVLAAGMVSWGAAAIAAVPQKDLSPPVETVAAISNDLRVRFATQGQTALEKQTVQVLYQGRPAAGAHIDVVTEGGWQKQLRTDGNGHFSITPLETQSKKEKYTYTVTYHDPSSGKTHELQRHVDVAKPRPEWAAKAHGFLLWLLAGLAVAVLFILGRILQRQKNEKKIAEQFEQYRSAGIGARGFKA